MPDESVYKSINQVTPFSPFSRQRANSMSGRAELYENRSKAIEPYKYVGSRAKYNLSSLRSSWVFCVLKQIECQCLLGERIQGLY